MYTAVRILKDHAVFYRNSNDTGRPMEHLHFVGKRTVVIDDPLGSKPLIQTEGFHKEINIRLNRCACNSEGGFIRFQKVKEFYGPSTR